MCENDRSMQLLHNRVARDITHKSLGDILYQEVANIIPAVLANSAPKLTQRINISQPALVEFDSRRRDSIPEEADEDKLVPAKCKTKSIPPPPTYDEATREKRKSWHSDDSTPT